MMLYNYTIDDIKEAPATLIKACDSCGKNNILASETGRAYKDDGEGYDFNASDIQTKIIQYVGRYCDSYASDVIIELCKLNPFLTEVKDGDGRWIIGLGLREMGVDHNEWIMHNLGNSNYYRKILAIDIQDCDMLTESKRTIQLKDITYSIDSYMDSRDTGKF